jgi:hypothetical protein
LKRNKQITKPDMILRRYSLRKYFFCFLILLFIIPACGGTKSIYEQKQNLMILDVTEQPRNKKALQNSRKRQKRNNKSATNRRVHHKSHRR